MSKKRLAARGFVFFLFMPAASLAAAAAAQPEAIKPPATQSEVAGKGQPKGDTAKAEAARKKPLQRCDQLADKAQVECLQKARERIVEARQKREAAKSGAQGRPEKEKRNDAPAKDAGKAAPGK